MKIRSIMIGSCALFAAMQTTAAMAQVAEDDDVVVMRRVVAPNKLGAPDPDPTPSSAQWTPGAWNWEIAGPQCTNSALKTRTVQCMANGNAVPEVQCTDPRPESSVVESRTDGCSHSWVVGSYGNWSSQCSSNAVRTRSVQCVYGAGTPLEASAPDGSCTEAKPDTQEEDSNYTSCSYAWDVGEWTWNGVVGEWSSNCSPNAMQERTVSCKREDGTVAGDGLCGNDKPTTTRRSYRDTACTNKWVPETSGLTGEASHCVNNQITVHERFKCVTQAGATVSSAHSLYCGKVGIGPLSAVADNVIPTTTQCSLGNATVGTSFVDLSYNTNVNVTIASGTIQISGAHTEFSAAARTAVAAACQAAVASNTSMAAPVCTLIKSYSHNGFSYFDWTIRNNAYYATGGTCAIYNENFIPPAGATSHKVTNCLNGKYARITYGTLNLHNSAVMQVPLTCQSKYNMITTGWLQTTNGATVCD